MILLDRHRLSEALAELNLVAIDDDEKLMVVRPEGVVGTEFPAFEKHVMGFAGGVVIRMGAPFAEVTALDKGRLRVLVTELYAPGPGPVYVDEELDDWRAAVTLLQNTYFGDKVDFTREDLRSFLPAVAAGPIAQTCLQAGCDAAPEPGTVFCSRHL